MRKAILGRIGIVAWSWPMRFPGSAIGSTTMAVLTQPELQRVLHERREHGSTRVATSSTGLGSGEGQVFATDVAGPVSRATGTDADGRSWPRVSSGRRTVRLAHADASGISAVTARGESRPGIHSMQSWTA